MDKPTCMQLKKMIVEQGKEMSSMKKLLEDQASMMKVIKRTNEMQASEMKVIKGINEMLVIKVKEVKKKLSSQTKLYIIFIYINFLVTSMY